jgi:type IV pilus assembly protein PilC
MPPGVSLYSRSGNAGVTLARMTITPGQISRRADFYFQLASLIAAGVPIIQALEMLQRSVSPVYRERIDVVIGKLNHGSDFTEAVAATGGWLPAFDHALFSAGEQSGRLDTTLRSLGNYYKERATMLRRVLSGVAYPIFILHFAILVFPTSYLTGLLLNNGGTAFLVQKLTVLLPLYLAIFFVIIAFQGNRGETWRALVERVTHVIPLVGRARQDLALSRLSAALEALLSAGVPIIHSWQLAADATASRRIKGAVAAAVPKMEAGVTPSETLRESSVFPELFRSLYATGEVSGQLDSTLQRLHHHYEEQASMKLQNLASWTPKIIFLFVAIGIGYQIVSFYSAYFNQINQIGF